MYDVDNGGVAEEVDDSPAWVKEGTENDEMSVAGEDYSGAHPMERSDVIDAAKGVEMYVKDVPVLDVFTPKDESDWFKISLKVTLVVGEKGIDGKGKYKNKHFFPRLLIKVNREAYPDAFTSQFYAPKVGGAFGDYNEFLTALGFKTNPAPANDKAFRQSLAKRKVIVDITKDKKRAKDQTSGKWVNTDEFENNLKYTGAPKQAAAAPAAEAAVS